jgi:hypothetical protein
MWDISCEQVDSTDHERVTVDVGRSAQTATAAFCNEALALKGERMMRSTFMAIAAVIAAVSGLGFILTPA